MLGEPCLTPVFDDHSTCWMMLATIACGYNRVGNRIIKLCSVGFHFYLTPFINLSHSLGQYLSEQKLANVIPLLKKDNCQLKANYRPVSLLAGFSKICEKVVFFYQNNFMMEIGFLDKLKPWFQAW